MNQVTQTILDREAQAIKDVMENGTPQLQTLLNHFLKGHGISQLEAAAIYRIAALPRRIADLQDKGIRIRKERKLDETGRAYVKYHLVD